MFRKMQFYQRMLLIVVAWSSLIAAPQAFATYKQITAGNYHTCGLKSDGSAICWGAGKDSTKSGFEHGQSIVPSSTFTQLSAGSVHTCGLKSDGSAICWGAGKTNTGIDEWGQSIVPSGTFTQISAGGIHTCGLKSDGSVTCWGAGKTNTGNYPEYGQSIVPSGTFTQISAGGGFHTCGLKSDGSAICWGDNQFGQSTAPSGTFTQINTGSLHTCGLKSNGSVTCWGAGKTNNAGHNYTESGQSIVPSGTFTQISAGGYHTCGLKSDGSAICWGDNQFGQSTAPSGTFTQINTGSLHTCGLKGDGSATCWGAGQINTGGRSLMEVGQSIVPIDSDCSVTEISAAKQAGIDQCRTNPASCGITKLDGISTNAFITPANKMIAGVLISGGTKRLMVRASSVDGAVDPLLEIVTYPDRKPLGSNDSWATDPAAAELTQKKLAPGRATDAAIIINLPPGLFTMEITSKNGASGAGLIEVYDMAVFP